MAKNKKELIYKNNMSISDIAKSLGLAPVEIIKKLMQLGVMANINMPLDKDTAELIAVELGYDFKLEAEVDDSRYDEIVIKEDPKNLVKRAPIITIMGHVDHGKTTLIDAIKKTRIALGESGGITQHIAAYQVEKNNEVMTFIDTPGHAAFTEMRSRGAKVTDIVILVVAADDGIMPQTIEAIEHAKVAKVPIIVAINKIDKPNAKIEQIKTKLTEYGVQPEDWGGDNPVVEISAKHNKNIDKLLDTILMVADLHELKANPNTQASGTVIEARLDKGMGAVASLIVANGTLKVGDYLVIGKTYGKVRTIKNDFGKLIKTAIPSQPVEITGIQDVPLAGDKFMVFKDEKEAKLASQKRAEREKDGIDNSKSLSALLASKDVKELNVIIKSDVMGSIEAIKNLLTKFNNDDFNINVVRSEAGAITEKDILLAETAKAFIIGFNVKPNNNIRNLSKERGVEIREYSVIYNIEEDIEKAQKGLLKQDLKEVIIGEAEVRDLFKIPKVGVIAGVFITSGLCKRNGFGRIIRDGVVVYQNKIGSLKHLKDDKKELKQGLEGGLTIENYQDYKVGDTIEFYEMVESSEE